MITQATGPQPIIDSIAAAADTSLLPRQHNAATTVPPTQASDTQNHLDKRWPEKRDTPPGAINSLDQVLDDLNNSMNAWSTGIRFSIDDEAQRLVVSIVDNHTGEVLRTVPSDAVIQIAKMIVQLQGQTVNVQA